MTVLIYGVDKVKLMTRKINGKKRLTVNFIPMLRTRVGRKN